MFVGKGTPTPGVPVISLYPDIDKKATAFFAKGYVLFSHRGEEDFPQEDFVSSAGKPGFSAGEFDRFAHLTKGVIHPVIGKTFQHPVQNSPAKWWKSGWQRGFSTLSTEFSTSGKILARLQTV